MENLLQSDQGHYVLCDFGSATARVLKPEVCIHCYTKRYKKWCHTGVWGTSHRRGDQEVYNIVLQVFSTSVSLTVIQMKWCFFCRSPEMVDLYSGLHITTKADIWALGCLLYKVVRRRTKKSVSNLDNQSFSYVSSHCPSESQRLQYSLVTFPSLSPQNFHRW